MMFYMYLLTEKTGKKKDIPTHQVYVAHMFIMQMNRFFLKLVVLGLNRAMVDSKEPIRKSTCTPVVIVTGVLFIDHNINL